MRSAQRPSRRPRRPSIVGLLIATLAMVAVSACGNNWGGPPPEDPPPAAPEPLSPRGAGPTPTAFTWKPVPGDRVYRVIVTDAAERRLHHYDVRNAPSAPFPAELKAMMAEPHAVFSWSVAIVTPDGRHLAESPPVQFWLK